MAIVETSYKLDSFADISTAFKKLYESQTVDNLDYIKRLRVEIPDIDLLSWLYHQTDSNKIFWSSRDYDLKIAGIGVADQLLLDESSSIKETLSTVQDNLSHSDERVRYFGGFKFDIYTATDDFWQEYGRGRMVIPRFELELKNQKTYFICNYKPEHDNFAKILDSLNKISFACSDIPAYNNKLISRTDYPEQEGWDKNLKLAFKAFESSEYEKIVLARRSLFEFEQKLNPLLILNRLSSVTPNCFNFCFQFKHDCSFVGASPERLYYRKRNQIECEAIAGTRARSAHDNEDSFFEKELLASEKDRREQRYVVNSIKEALAELTSNGELKRDHPVGVVKLSRLMHLISRFKLSVKDDITDFELLNSLHPTAAVGGYPQKETLYKINEIENFDRGWYAAPVGWISKERSEFAVAIRSGLIISNSIYLYSGAGIVDGSQSGDEWLEIENKISNFLKALGV